MWQLMINASHFLAEVILGALVVVGFVCWVWFVVGLLYYRHNKDLPDYHVQADEHEGMRWWNAWRWSVSDRFRPLKDNTIIESSIFSVAAFLAFVWALDLIFK